MKKLSYAILCLSAISNFALAQPRLTKADFAVGKVAVDANIGSVLHSLGKPTKLDSLDDDEVGGFTVYYYGGLIIWTESPTGKISSFEISTSLLKTKRGLCVGDSVTKLERLYGKKPSESELDRAHNNYEMNFKDFTELKTYEYDQSEHDVFYAIFYIKDSKVVRIYLYRGLGC
jgi:hypothetical protein